MLLKLLEDKNGEVQNLAVKCLGPLVSKVKDYQVEAIVDTLCNNMVRIEASFATSFCNTQSHLSLSLGGPKRAVA